MKMNNGLLKSIRQKALQTHLALLIFKMESTPTTPRFANNSHYFCLFLTEDNLQMFLQIFSPSVDDQITEFYCKNYLCYWPLCENDLTRLSPFCLRDMGPFPGVVWQAFYLTRFSKLMPSLWGIAYSSWDSCKRAVLLLRNGGKSLPKAWF